MSDGVHTIKKGKGTFLNSSFITTNDAGDITDWIIVVLIGARRTFVLGDQCCTTGDPSFLYTYCCSGPTDASIQTDGFFGIGPETGFAYNTGAAGVWTVSISEPVAKGPTASRPAPAAARRGPP
jgi:hypothetical protein